MGGHFWLGAAALTLTFLCRALQGAAQSPARASFDLETATIEHINRAFDAGALTSVRLVQLYLARIEAYDEHGPRINAVLSMNPDALRIASELDDERRARGPRSRLHGIPVLLKDNIDTGDMPTTAGSVTLAGSVPRDDAFVVRRLREAGAIILGKVNLSEFATPAGWGSYSSINGNTLNPYDLRRDPSGSSGGTAAAIAANFATVGLGTDTGGSIRGPAAATGLVGIRPTYGLVSRDGIVPQAPSMDVPGPMARNVTDAAITLSIIAGPDPSDPVTAESRGRSYGDYTQFLDANGLRGARIGVLREFFGGSPEVDALMEAALDDLRASGAVVVDSVTLGDEFFRATSGLRNRINAEFRPYIEAYFATLGPGFPRTLRDLLAAYESAEATGAALVNPGLIETHIRNLEIGGLDNPEYVDATQRVLPLVRDLVADLMDHTGVVALVYPTARCPARPLHTLEDSGFTCRSGPSGPSVASYGRLPDIQVPAGFTSEGLPVTISFVGRPYSEPQLLEIAFSYESATQHRRAPPTVPPLNGERFVF